MRDVEPAVFLCSSADLRSPATATSAVLSHSKRPSRGDVLGVTDGARPVSPRSVWHEDLQRSAGESSVPAGPLGGVLVVCLAVLPDVPTAVRLRRERVGERSNSRRCDRRPGSAPPRPARSPPPRRHQLRSVAAGRLSQPSSPRAAADPAPPRAPPPRPRARPILRLSGSCASLAPLGRIGIA